MRAEHLQQHGFVHAGVITTLADHTAGGAARAAVPPGTDVITIEFKINFLMPAKAGTLAATGQVLRAGKTIIASESEVFAMTADGPVLGGEVHVDARCHPAARADPNVASKERPRDRG